MPVQEIKLKAASDAPSKSGLENVPPDQLERAMKAAMARSDGDLDLTEEEQNKFTKAFQDKEFRKMMAEYVDEISDPKHRAEQDAYIREMEAKGETPKDKRVIHPSAGFVVKTKKEDGAKLFINVVSSTEVEQPTSTSVGGGSQWQLPHLLGPPRMERDKKDNSVGAFDCCFHPLALQHAENARPFRDLLVSTAIDAVEQSYKKNAQPTKLSRTYHVLLGVKYKTGPPQALMVSSDFNGKPPPANKKKNKKKKKPEGPSFADNIRGSLKSQPKPEPEKPLDDQRARARKLLEKANRKPSSNAAATPVDPLDAPTSIKERGAFDLQNFRIGAGSEADRRPKELVVEVSLEKCSTAKGLDLELDQASFKLKMVLDGTVLYDVKRTLPYPVDGTKGSAKFDRKRRTLTVVAPVLPRSAEEEEKDRQMRQAQPESVVKVISGSSEPEVIREHTTAFGQRRRERVVEPRETLEQKDQRLAKAPPRQKKADDHARFLEKRAKPSRVTPRPPSNEKTKEKTWSASESDEDDDDDLVPSINASIAEDNVERARKAAAGFKAAPDVVDNNFVASKTYTGTRKGFVFKKGAKGLGYYRDAVSVAFLPEIEARQRATTATVIIDAAGVSSVNVTTEGTEARVSLDGKTFGLRLGGQVQGECRADAADANVVLVFTKSGDETWPTVAEAFSLDDAVVDTEAPTDEEPDDEVAPPSLIQRDDAPPPPPPPAATQTFAAPEFQNTLLYNID